MDFLENQLENFADNERMLEQIKKDLAALMPPKQRSKPKPRPTRKERDSDGDYIGPIRRNPGRSSRRVSYLVDRSPPRTRSNSLSSASSTSSSPSNRMVVKFGFCARDEFNEDTDSDMEEEEAEKPKRKRVSNHFKTVKRDERGADEITEDDLNMVAVKVQEKVYDKNYGSTCHQCRQKTNDMKTICRSGFCIGIQGQFCGPCLYNRYGEDVKTALKDPSWQCPPCRKICNCSICRNRKGKACTGIMIHLARECGFSNVADYLQSLRTKCADKVSEPDQAKTEGDQQENQPENNKENEEKESEGDKDIDFDKEKMPSEKKE